jgi:hypothetical protein
MKYYIIHTEDDIEPYVLGPYKSDKTRLRRAKQLRKKDSEGKNGIFRLDVPEDHDREKHPYSYSFITYELNPNDEDEEPFSI